MGNISQRATIVLPRGENLEPEERKLQIKLAQLNVILQVSLALMFGGLAGAIALVVFEVQIVLGNFPLFSFATFAAIVSAALVVMLSYIGILSALDLRQCLREFKNLQ